MLSAPEAERYGRQVMSKLGAAGQRALLDARVLVVGAGGLGCPCAIYLCGAGLGSVGIVDGDVVELSNLHRQVGHPEARLHENKAISLRTTCLSLNSKCDVRAYPKFAESSDELATVVRDGGYNLLVDCTDSPKSRCLVNDAAVAANVPLVMPTAVGFSGQLAVYNVDGGLCYRCVFPPEGEPAGPVARGIMGPTAGIMGTLGAMEAVQILASMPGVTLRGRRMLLFDSLDPVAPARIAQLQRRPGCRCCGDASTPQSEPAAVEPVWESAAEEPPMPVPLAAAVPTSGHHEDTLEVSLTHKPLSLDALVRSVADNACGAVTTFSGNTRNYFEGKTVVRLEYEAYECMALTEMEKIAREVLGGSCGEGVKKVACAHRLGLVPEGESSVIIAVASGHRAEGFVACRYMIDEIKARVPIWKKEIYTDGSAWKENKEWPGVAEAEAEASLRGIAPAKRRRLEPPSANFAPPGMVRLLLFGPARDAMDADHVDVEVASTESVARLRLALQAWPALEAILPASRFCIEQELIQKSEEAGKRLASTMALIPPVSGG